MRLVKDSRNLKLRREETLELVEEDLWLPLPGVGRKERRFVAVEGVEAEGTATGALGVQGRVTFSLQVKGNVECKEASRELELIVSNGAAPAVSLWRRRRQGGVRQNALGSELRALGLRCV